VPMAAFSGLIPTLMGVLDPPQPEVRMIRQKTHKKRESTHVERPRLWIIYPFQTAKLWLGKLAPRNP